MRDTGLEHSSIRRLYPNFAHYPGGSRSSLGAFPVKCRPSTRPQSSDRVGKGLLRVNRVDSVMSAICRVRGSSRKCRIGIDGVGLDVIQAPQTGARIMRGERSDYEWAAIGPLLPNKPRGMPRVDDRRVLNGIFWAVRSGATRRDLAENSGPYTTPNIPFLRIVVLRIRLYEALWLRPKLGFRLAAPTRGGRLLRPRGPPRDSRPPLSHPRRA